MRLILLAVLLGSSGFLAGMYGHEVLSEDEVNKFSDPMDRYRAERNLTGDDVDVPDVSGPSVTVIGGTTYDFNTMEVNTSKSHKFIFKNVGDKPTELKVLRSSCKCTIGSIADTNLEPGEETTVELSWSAENMLNTFSQTATIGTDDPRNQEIKLTITGSVVGALTIEPQQLIFGMVSPGRSASKSATLYSNYIEPLKIVELEWPSENQRDFIDIEKEVRKVEPGTIEDHPDANYAIDFTVTVLPGMRAGRLEGSLPIKVDVGDIETVQLQYSGQVIDTVRIISGTAYDEERRIFDMGQIESSRGADFNFVLGVAADLVEDLEIDVKSVEPADSVQVTVDEPKKIGNQLLFPVRLEVPKGAPPVSFGGANPTNFGNVVFRSNIPSSPQIPLFLRLVITED